jgi:hypothetical protein
MGGTSLVIPDNDCTYVHRIYVYMYNELSVRVICMQTWMREGEDARRYAYGLSV